MKFELDLRVDLRPIDGSDLPLLRKFLLHAIHREPGEPFPSTRLLRNPELRRYVEGWMREGDYGVKALAAERPVGAAWLRRWAASDRGYGWIRDDVPELSMAVLPDWRGRGIGTQLLSAIVEATPGPISLSVAKLNPATRLYRRCGFAVADDDGTTLTMLREPA